MPGTSLKKLPRLGYIFCLSLFAGCYLGSTRPAGREPNLEEQVYIDIAQRLEPRASLSNILVVADSDAVADFCQPGAASCAFVTLSKIYYDGEDMWAFVHELVHIIQWSVDRNTDYNHEIEYYWKESGGVDSLQCRIWEGVDENIC